MGCTSSTEVSSQEFSCFSFNREHVCENDVFFGFCFFALWPRCFVCCFFLVWYYFYVFCLTTMYPPPYGRMPFFFFLAPHVKVVTDAHTGKQQQKHKLGGSYPGNRRQPQPQYTPNPSDFNKQTGQATSHFVSYGGGNALVLQPPNGGGGGTTAQPEMGAIPVGAPPKQQFIQGRKRNREDEDCEEDVCIHLGGVCVFRKLSPPNFPSHCFQKSLNSLSCYTPFYFRKKMNDIFGNITSNAQSINPKSDIT